MSAIITPMNNVYRLGKVSPPPVPVNNRWHVYQPWYNSMFVELETGEFYHDGDNAGCEQCTQCIEADHPFRLDYPEDGHLIIHATIHDQGKIPELGSECCIFLLIDDSVIEYYHKEGTFWGWDTYETHAGRTKAFTPGEYIWTLPLYGHYNKPFTVIEMYMGYYNEYDGERFVDNVRYTVTGIYTPSGKNFWIIDEQHPTTPNDLY